MHNAVCNLCELIQVSSKPILCRKSAIRCFLAKTLLIQQLIAVGKIQLNEHTYLWQNKWSSPMQKVTLEITFISNTEVNSATPPRHSVLENNSLHSLFLFLWTQNSKLWMSLKSHSWTQRLPWVDEVTGLLYLSCSPASNFSQASEACIIGRRFGIQHNTMFMLKRKGLTHKQ